MDQMKKFLKYILWIVGFFILSEFLINVGLNSSYKEIESKGDTLEGVEIYQSEATSVNGRIKGVIKNEDGKINKKYLKIDFYSPRDVNMGSKYIEIDPSAQNMPFEAFFKLNHVSYYKMSFTDEKDSKGEIEFIPKDLSKPEIILGTLFVMIMLT